MQGTAGEARPGNARHGRRGGETWQAGRGEARRGVAGHGR